MILASGARGLGFNSRTGPLLTLLKNILAFDFVVSFKITDKKHNFVLREKNRLLAGFQESVLPIFPQYFAVISKQSYVLVRAVEIICFNLGKPTKNKVLLRTSGLR